MEEKVEHHETGFAIFLLAYYLHVLPKKNTSMTDAFL